jgi:hypothetical protein
VRHRPTIIERDYRNGKVVMWIGYVEVIVGPTDEAAEPQRTAGHGRLVVLGQPPHGRHQLRVRRQAVPLSKASQKT